MSASPDNRFANWPHLPPPPIVSPCNRPMRGIIRGTQRCRTAELMPSGSGASRVPRSTHCHAAGPSSSFLLAYAGVKGWVATGGAKKAWLRREIGAANRAEAGYGPPRPGRTRLAQTSAKRGPTGRLRREPRRAHGRTSCLPRSDLNRAARHDRSTSSSSAGSPIPKHPGRHRGPPPESPGAAEPTAASPANAT
jgi:hypothetical protein